MSKVYVVMVMAGVKGSAPYTYISSVYKNKVTATEYAKRLECDGNSFASVVERDLNE